METQMHGIDGAATAADEARPVKEIAGDLGSAAVELYKRVDLARQIQEHPYRTLAIAAGLGYVIGGGLFTPLTRHLLGVGMRVAVLPALQSSLLAGAGIDPEALQSEGDNPFGL